MTRATAQYLIRKVNQLMPDGIEFNADEVLAALDHSRIERVFYPIPALEQYSGSDRVYMTYVGGDYWEQSLTFEDSAHGLLSPDSYDYEFGRFSFNADQGLTHIYVTGWEHDLNAAAADLIDRAALNLSLDLTSFTTVNGSAQRAEKSKSLKDAARLLRAKVKKVSGQGTLKVAHLVRTDVNSRWHRH